MVKTGQGVLSASVCQNATFIQMQSFMLFETHLSQKDERALPGSLQSRKIFILILKCDVSH
jgi:hypothetical protein